MNGLFGGRMTPGHIGCLGAILFTLLIVVCMLGMVWLVGRALEVF